MNRFVEEDCLNVINNSNIEWNHFNDKVFLVTGATGLIGSAIINTLYTYACKRNKRMKIIALVRNLDKAKVKFKDLCNQDNVIEFLEQDITDTINISSNVDYIIHAASETSSKGFIERPVEVINTALTGTKSVLELARSKNISKVVYLSSMEVYGTPKKGSRMTENDVGAISPSNIRNGYPISKIMCENICNAYYSEYQVPVCTLRLTQTFGPGVSYNDGRVFAEFARCAIETRDIVLKTKGETERSYLYIGDAVSAILIALVKGKNGEAYTVANENTYCSIAQMAHLVGDMSGINVEYELQDVSKLGYATTLHMDLDTDKIQKLGWNAKIDLKEAFERLITYLSEEK